MQTDAALLNDILVASADAIIVTGEGQCIMVFNTSAQTMLGYSAAMNGGKD
jgi:PAS domain S-box-containing protein